jgi:hypothetical protein
VVFIWHEDGKGQLPGDPEPTVDVSVPTKANSVRVVQVIIALDKRTPMLKQIFATDGKVTLTVGKTPLLIEE